MANLIKNLANLVKVKTIVTFVVVMVFAVLALNGAISPDNVMIITSSVIAFYFGTQLEKSNTETISDHSLCPFMNESTESIESTEKDGE